MAKRYARQLDIVDVEKLSMPIHIIGNGGIGSWVSLLLCKMGCSNVNLYDDDTVEDHNIASQFFKVEDLGKVKSVCSSVNSSMFCGYQPNFHTQEEEEDIEGGVVIFAMDSMKERIRLGELYKDKDIIIIDGRMGGLQAEVYVRRSNNYLPTTVAPDDVQPDACTAKSISFNCAFIGSMIANYLRLIANESIDLDSDKNQFVFLFDGLQLLKPSRK